MRAHPGGSTGLGASARHLRASFVNRSAKSQLRWVVAAFLLLTTSIVVYNAVATARERSLVLRIDVAARQRSTTESYIKDVLLKSSGVEADPGSEAKSLVETAAALLDGGDVPAVQGAGGIVRMAPATGDWRVTAKLEPQQRLIGRLIAAGNRFLRTGPGDAVRGTLAATPNHRRGGLQRHR